jgi:hypothetical protein
MVCSDLLLKPLFFQLSLATVSGSGEAGSETTTPTREAQATLPPLACAQTVSHCVQRPGLRPAPRLTAVVLSDQEDLEM